MAESSEWKKTSEQLTELLNQWKTAGFAGKDLDDALWAELKDKKNMVLMTSIAVVAGMVPQLWSADGMKVSMGAVMIGGMLASLLFTFTLTPALFVLIERARKWKPKFRK